MREAAEKAGIPSDKLSISLEPEAASLFCRYLSVEKTVNKCDVSIAAFPAKTRYMILDAGGGTIDITVHEVEDSRKVKEVKAASGGGWGGILVDKAFEHLVEDIVGKDIYKKFKENETEDWLDLWRDFEVKKRTVRPEKDARIVMKFPLSLVKLIEKKHGQAFEDYIDCSDYADILTVTGDKLKFQASVFKTLFDTSVNKTIQHIEHLLRDETARMINVILMVGGFSESPMLQKAVRSAFPGIKVVIPVDATTSVMRGALIFGHSPKSITERVLKNTYGLKASLNFKEGVHPEERRTSSDIGDQCFGVFSKHVERNQIVKVGEAQSERKYRAAHAWQTELPFKLYASDLQNPKFVDEGCTYVGTMTVELTDHDGDLERWVWVSLTFSGTEIEVQARDEKSGKRTKATLNFLG
ncbi:heat shock 70 kDa protein 12B-like [Mercenaria mercenaria]|uniref:heat shock 70 kDa protein 12B-like n=1 Tax=Mercenaria mercenaria TaxID=6596 RepID=UPI00234F0657|nr:heat shock 70 kDa protein 12B-like [Mercenaria mercenaria]